MANRPFTSTVTDAFQTDFPSGDRFKVFQQLMHKRIREVLLVSNPYNLFLLEEDGRIYEQLREEYYSLGLDHSPEFQRISSAKDALEQLKNRQLFDMVITTAHSQEMSARDFAKRVKKLYPNLPIVHLVFDTSEFDSRLRGNKKKPFDHIFTWSGDYRIIIAIIKLIEDEANIRRDVDIAGVQVILVVEDNIRFYSRYLPLLYTELLGQSKKLLPEGVNLYHKFLRMRARPKIILATNFEEAKGYFDTYNEHIMGVISDVNYYRNGKADSNAGLAFTRYVKKRKSDIPILLQSHDEKNRLRAFSAGASFLNKDAPDLLQRLNRFVKDSLGFGDFIFRNPDYEEVGRAHDLKSMRKMLEIIPESSLQYHADRNHFSNWLKARREFWLAYQLRKRSISDYNSLNALREDLVSSLNLYLTMQRRGILSDFNAETFDTDFGFARLGGGSIGGKARGLSFLNLLLNNHSLYRKFENVHISVPPTLILGSDVFDRFMDYADLREISLQQLPDADLLSRFMQAPFPDDIAEHLLGYLEKTTQPIAVRSSSLLEDSQYFPFAGIYDTVMLANNQPDINIRLTNLIRAIKTVYASTYSSEAREYMLQSSFRLEEEKMAIVIQTVVGNKYGQRFYPEVSGVARSYNYYSLAPAKSTDGVASLVLGLGQMVVEGGKNVNFCPAYPHHIAQFSTIEQTLRSNQTSFFAISLDESAPDNTQAINITREFPVSAADDDGSLYFVASTYSHQNYAIYDGVSRPGMRVITFAPILKQELFPLSDIISSILKLGAKGMGTHIEIEFAVRMARNKSELHEFSLLQMRPLADHGSETILTPDDLSKDGALCFSDQVLGNGEIDDIKDIVFITPSVFDRSATSIMAAEIGRFNKKLQKAGRFYLLIALGRLGSNDPWLGIPVSWNQIASSKAIIESGITEMVIEPSQASHFFHNVCAFHVNYFSVQPGKHNQYVNWEWLEAHPVKESLKYTRHIRLKKPLKIKVDGTSHRGLILLPGEF